MLDYKDRYILNLLISSNQTLRILDISRLIGISQRSAYYSMSRINDYLESVNLPKLVNKRQQGIYIDPMIRTKLQDGLFENLQKYYLCTQRERNAIQMLFFLIQHKDVSVSYFEDLFEISRNTVFSDIKETKKILSVYNLALEYNQSSGYVVEGSELRKRSVMISLISNYEYLLKINSYDLFDQGTVDEIYQRLTKLEKELSIKYVNDTIVYLSMLLGMIVGHQLQPVTFNEEDLEMITKSREYSAVVNMFKDFFDDNEILYTTMQILGLRIQDVSAFEYFEDDVVTEIVDFMIQEFSKLTLIYFDDEEGLFRHLYLHMKQAMYRLKYGIIFQNELKDEIFENFPQITHVVKQIGDKLEEWIGYPIGDDDIAYIAMHFGGYLKREKREIPKVKVLLVCLNGIATSKLLKKELEYLIGSVEIIDVVRKDDIELYKNEVDFIISTIPIHDIQLREKVINVHSILTDRDREHIIRKIGVQNPTYADLDLSSKIFEDIKAFVPTEKWEDIRRKILTRINNRNVSIDYSKRNNRPMLKELIDNEKILLLDHVASWQDAIKQSAKPLLDLGYIEQSYVEKVIQNVNELGPYIVIAPNIAISHARPEDGVNELGMTFLLLNEPVNFSTTSDRNVRIVVTLAAPDNEQHLLALQQLSKLFIEQIDVLLQATSKQEILDLVAQYSKGE